MKKNIAIAGASGFTGIEAVKILSQHPNVNLVAVAANSSVGETLSKFMETGAPEMKFCEVDAPEVNGADVIFSCLPHKTGMSQVKGWVENGKTVFDLSADFRLKDAALYEEWYGVKHLAKELLKGAVYGLPELYRDAISKANLVAVPGCYPTASILALLPALEEGLIEPNVIVNAVSGTSGAGRGFDTSNVKDGTYAYGFPRHRHTPEMEEVLKDISGEEVKVTFVPHLGNFERGIYATVYAKLKGKVSQEKVSEAYVTRYGSEHFVFTAGQLPMLKDVQNTNSCAVHPLVDERNNRLVVFGAIDNLLKGAAGQAVQCFNIRFGFDEAEGLDD
ncbi:MAG: N-acetyl-gamma-glutamyl-phosphate reductase [Nitrospinota bacterium]|nr:N-acetyl-gamma-glutamyl-phosphate reductase [Nitrospinota bacterium]